MQVTFNIPDELIQRAVEDRLKALIASITGEQLTKQVERILAVKFERVDPVKIMEHQAYRLVESRCDAAYGRNDAIHKALAAAAEKIIREKK
jgi:hypothetical protein